MAQNEVWAEGRNQYLEINQGEMELLTVYQVKQDSQYPDSDLKFSVLLASTELFLHWKMNYKNTMNFQKSLPSDHCWKKSETDSQLFI